MSYDLAKKIPNHSNHLIDLRSDTVTKPTNEMRKIMADAEVGDDVYGEDPTINRLEKMLAERLGKEAGVLMTSGTQSNLCSVLTHCARGEEVIIGNSYHIYIDEAAGASVLGGVAIAPIETGNNSELLPENIAKAVKPDDLHCPISKLVCMENTVWGEAIPLDKMNDAKKEADAHNLSTHLDGARFFNAVTKLGCTPTDLASCADTVSICLSKGLGTPAGSVLLLPKELEGKARRWRKMLGGGMRQAGIFAAAGIYAIENNINRLLEDQERAEFLANELKKYMNGNAENSIKQKTNMVFFTPQKKDSQKLSSFLNNKGIIINEPMPSTRMVMHLDISDNDLSYIVRAFDEFYNS